MFLNDFYSTIQWWSVLFVLGLGFLPLTFFFFQKFFDKGYIFSKLLALAITGYVVFLLSVLHVTSFTTLTIGSVFFVLSVSLYYLFRKERLLRILKDFWPVFVFEELLFFAALNFWALIHAFGPDIHGLEKYMDYGFINSILRSDYFPPKDMWLTPFSINYYYFGHFLTALLTKLSYLPSNITFNLMLSTIFAFCFTQTFSIGANLFVVIQEGKHFSKIKLLLSGFLTAFLVTLSGNLHILYALFKPYNNDKVVPFWELPFTPLDFPNSYWYPNATRFIYNTIHEFPIYSWVVADLHGHVLDIPFVLLTIAVLFSLILNSKSEAPNSKQIQKFWYLPLLGFLLAVMYMTNAWDGIIYLLLSAFVLLYISYKKTSTLFERSRTFLISMVSIAGFFFIIGLPYNIFFKPFASGIGILCAPEFLTQKAKIGPFLFEPNHCQHSLWWELIVLYGFFLFFILSFLVFINKLKKLLLTDIFTLLLIILSILLIVIPEFIYLKDIYPAHYRANTMFKLVFQAFIMLSISSAYIMVRIISSMTHKALSVPNRLFAICYILVSTALLSLVMTYPYLAVKSYYNNLRTYKTLNGTNYLRDLYPSDFKAIGWLNTSVKGQPVILEAQGDSYTDYARVSVHTGLPTVLGWTVHEWLWRGNYDVPAEALNNISQDKQERVKMYYPAPRITDVKTLYETKDKNLAAYLIKKYNITYVFIGNLEHEKYPTLDEKKFADLGTLVFTDRRTKIYKVNN